MREVSKRIKYASTRMEVITTLEDAGFNTSTPMGLLIRSSRQSKDWAVLDLLNTARQKLEVLPK